MHIHDDGGGTWVSGIWIERIVGVAQVTGSSPISGSESTFCSGWLLMELSTERGSSV
jgi:hypothetical protein